MPWDVEVGPFTLSRPRRAAAHLTRESESPTREGLAGKAPVSAEETASATPAPPAAEAPHSAGSVLGGRYRIEQVLGFGGMGVVYRARDLKLDSEIALKRIRPDRF
ncbi:MAG TPA: hypothetical protein VGK70_14930, partial [Thermoanaerobaculia bacterium]